MGRLYAVLYLSSLLTGRLVLGSLTEVFYSLVFGQEVLLLRHFLSLDTLVQQLPVNTPKRGRLEISVSHKSFRIKALFGSFSSSESKV